MVHNLGLMLIGFGIHMHGPGVCEETNWTKQIDSFYGVMPYDFDADDDVDLADFAAFQNAWDGRRGWQRILVNRTSSSAVVGFAAEDEPITWSQIDGLPASGLDATGELSTFIVPCIMPRTDEMLIFRAKIKDGEEYHTVVVDLFQCYCE